jgi:hypothetical protein
MAALVTEAVSVWDGRPTIWTMHNSHPFLLCTLGNAPLTVLRHLSLDNGTFSGRPTMPHATVRLSTFVAGEDTKPPEGPSQALFRPYPETFGLRRESR